MTGPEIATQPPLPEVAGYEAHKDTLSVQFEDGHEIVTRGNTGGWSPTDAIETFALRRDKQDVAKYQSPYQHPRNTDSRNGFIVLQEDYSLARVAEYWTAADSHIRALVDEAGSLARLHSQNESAYNAFILVSNGHRDMMDVVTGRAEVHTS
jgi:hypothetical protein